MTITYTQLNERINENSSQRTLIILQFSGRIILQAFFIYLILPFTNFSSSCFLMVILKVLHTYCRFTEACPGFVSSGGDSIFWEGRKFSSGTESRKRRGAKYLIVTKERLVLVSALYASHFIGDMFRERAYVPYAPRLHTPL